MRESESRNSSEISTAKRKRSGDDKRCWCCQNNSRRSFSAAMKNDPRGRSPNHSARIEHGHAKGARLGPAGRSPGSRCARCSAGNRRMGCKRDRRPHCAVPQHATHALSAQEREQLLRVANDRVCGTAAGAHRPMLATRGRIWPANPNPRSCG